MHIFHINYVIGWKFKMDAALMNRSIPRYYHQVKHPVFLCDPLNNRYTFLEIHLWLNYLNSSYRVDDFLRIMLNSMLPRRWGISSVGVWAHLIWYNVIVVLQVLKFKWHFSIIHLPDRQHSYPLGSLSLMLLAM